MNGYHAHPENERFLGGRGEVRVGLLMALAVILAVIIVVLGLVIEPAQLAAWTT